MPTQTLAQMLASIADGGKNTAAEMRAIITDLHEILHSDASSSGVSINNVADQTIWTQDVTLAVGDIIEIETWGRGNNGTGAQRAWTFTLDADGAFDMEWAWNAAAVNQAWRITAKLVVVATNFAAWEMIVHHNASGDGTLQSDYGKWYGYETTTNDLTGTTTISLKGRVDSATGTQDVYPYGTVIRRVTG